MSLVESAAKESAGAVVVGIGQSGAEVAAAVANRWPVRVHNLDRDAAWDLTAVLADLQRPDRNAAAQPTLPGVLILASTTDADVVADVLKQLREAALTMRPRLWPAFVAGDPVELAKFDATLDEAPAGLCDLVLVTTGAPTLDDQADALVSWLQVKLPAPPSVLGELPDAQGRICRYVALGTRNLAAIAQVDVPELAAVEWDRPRIAAAAAAQVRGQIEALPEVKVLSQQAVAFEMFGERGDAAAILRAENTFAAGLTDLRETIRRQLDRAIPAALAAAVREPDAPGPAPAAEPEQATGSADPTSDRAAAVSRLMLMVSKGGLSKLFSRSRIAAAAQQSAQAASTDLRAVITTELAGLDARLTTEVEPVIVAREQELRTEQTRAREHAAEQAQHRRRTELATARSQAAVWPKVDTSGIRRAWGGSVPAPRTYLLGSVIDLTDSGVDDGSITVVDVRKAQPPEPADPKQALLLVAQYGLPHAAFR